MIDENGGYGSFAVERATRLGGLALAAAVACAQDAAPIELPADVAFVAVVRLNGGEVVEATPLQRADQPITFFSDSDGTLAIVGYPASPLTEWLEQWFDDVLPTVPLEATGSVCRPTLPDPVFLSVRPPGSSFESTSAHEAPALTPPWLVDRCPEFDADQVSVDIGCDTNACLFARRKAGPCRFDVDLDDCGQPPAEIVVLPDGQACLEPHTDRMCTRTATAFDAAGSYVCSVLTAEGNRIDSCATEIFLVRQPSLRIVQSRTLTPLPANFPIWLSGGTLSPVQESDDLQRGPLIDIVATADQVAVLGLPDSANRANAICPTTTNRPRTLYLLDPQSLAPRTTVPLPDCAAHLVSDPAGDGFLFVYPDRTARSWALARTDASGAVTATSLLPIPDDQVLQDLVPSAAGIERAYVLALTDAVDDAQTGAFLEIDTTTLTTTATTAVVGRFLSLATSASGEILLGSSRINDISFLRSPFEDLGNSRIPFSFGSLLRNDLRVIDLSAVGPNDQAAAAISGNRPSMIAWRGATLAPAGPLDFRFQPGPVVAWTGRPSRALFGGVVTVGDPVGFVQVFDVEAARMVPGPVYTDSGVTALAVAPNGEIYALLGWTSQVLRIAPTP